MHEQITLFAASELFGIKAALRNAGYRCASLLLMCAYTHVHTHPYTYVHVHVCERTHTLLNTPQQYFFDALKHNWV